MDARRFVVLWRAFFAQLFSSDAVVSEQQMRQAMVGVLAFLVTPGLLIPFQLAGAFEFAAIRFPVLVEPLTRLMMTIFVTYSVVSVGVIAAFAWDDLSFDRRDAMVLGPLPLGSGAVIAAKLAAMGAFLAIAAGAINLITAVPFAMIAGNHLPVTSAPRQMIAHLAATLSAATFVFCAFVTVRALLGLFGGGRIAAASILQFLVVTALLSFVALVPTAVVVVPGGRSRGRVVPAAVHQRAIPAWSPTNWFLGLYDVVRGTSAPDAHAAASRALLFTAVAVAAAIAMTIAGYRRQLRLALTPPASPATLGISRLQRGIAQLLAGRDRLARATADFVLITIARNRPQQAPIAINAAVGVMMLVVALWRYNGDPAALVRTRALAFAVPLVLAFWTTIGLRAACFVPSELPAAWSFRAHAPTATPGFAAGTCAAVMAFVSPAAGLLAIAVAAGPFGWQTALRHAAFVAASIAVLAEIVVFSLDAVPFTQPYRPGHARLKTRWPVYLFGALVFGFGAARLDDAVVDRPAFFGVLVAFLASAALLARLGRRRASTWMGGTVEPDESDDGVAVLNIGFVQATEQTSLTRV